MTLEQFKEALVSEGYVNTYSDSKTFQKYEKGDSAIIVQEWSLYSNVFYDGKLDGNEVSFNQHRIINFGGVLENIKEFERKLGL